MLFVSIWLIFDRLLLEGLTLFGRPAPPEGRQTRQTDFEAVETEDDDEKVSKNVLQQWEKSWKNLVVVVLVATGLVGEEREYGKGKLPYPGSKLLYTIFSIVEAATRSLKQTQAIFEALPRH